MLDVYARKLINKPLDSMVKFFPSSITAVHVTLYGFALGILGVVLTAFGLYLWGLLFFVLSRVCDGLDGALARERGIVSDEGAYLDIVCDFILYSSLPLGFGLANLPENGISAMILMLTFMGTGSSFLAHAIFAAQRGETTELRGKKSFYYSAGLMEGSETILAFFVFYIFPEHFWWLGLCVAFLCVVTTVSRVVEVCRILKKEAP
jgi:phosphatidylglycerophosphate synthase